MKMKTPLGKDAYLEPDEGPRDSKYHMRIVRLEPILSTRAGYNATLACGHGVQIYGNLSHTNNVVLCTKCRDLDEPAPPVPGGKYPFPFIECDEHPGPQQSYIVCIHVLRGLAPYQHRRDPVEGDSGELLCASCLERPLDPNIAVMAAYLKIACAAHVRERILRAN